MNSLVSSAPTWKRYCIIILPFALAHFISYIYRTVNVVVYPELAQELNLAAGQIGLLTSAYFFTFALAQLPIGVLLDRYGPRQLQVPMLFIAACGAVGFSCATTVTEFVIARGVIGLGVAACLMSAIKASSLWFSQAHLPLIMSLLLSFGGIGAMVSTVPMHNAIDMVGWRNAFVILALLTLCVAGFIFFSVPRYHQRDPARFVDMCLAVKQLYCAWSFWRLVLYSVVANAVYMSVLGLWMGPWLRDVGHLPITDISFALFLCAIAMFVGSLLFGTLSNYLRRFGVQPVAVCGVGIILFVLCQCLMILDVGVSPLVIAVGFSFFGAAVTMNYAIIAQSVPTHLTGRVSTSFNVVIFFLAFVIQWAMGEIIHYWSSVSGSSSLLAYQYAMGIMIIFQVLGLLVWVSFKPWCLDRNVANSLV